MPFELVAEGFWLRSGTWAYPGAIRSLTMFPGRYYQFPIYEILLRAAMWTGLSAIRYFRNDKGETIAQRGIDRVLVGPRRRTGLRLLALVGVTNALLLVGYCLPMQWFSLHADPWPRDVLERSYLTDGMCGPGTPYACSGRVSRFRGRTPPISHPE